MKVVVRVRPLMQQENDSKAIVDVMDDQVLVFDPKEETEDFYFQGVKQRDFLKKENKNVNYMFDRVFGPDVSNDEVHEKTTKSVIAGLFNGYNCSVFAYGATGAGKTFTMLGNAESPGITFLTMLDLFQHIESVSNEKSINVAVSYLEVYNENIRDLLSPGKETLQLREDPKRGTLVMGLSIKKPTSAEEILQMLRDGNCNRSQHPTDANAESSRSHAVFTVYVSQSERSTSGKAVVGAVRVAKMSLIDLAGSERATMINSNRGARMREGANINKSLLALGNCINALADTKNKPFIPYRNSKLTRLLKDSLGGNCSTVMIAAVSSAQKNYEDTYNTLKYANRAKNIRVNLKQNVVNVDMHVAQYAKLVEDLRSEIAQLKTKLRTYEESAKVPAPMPHSDTTDPALPPLASSVQPPLRAVAIIPPSLPISAQLKPQFRELFGRRFAAQRSLLQMVSQAHGLELRVDRRQQRLDQMASTAVVGGGPTKGGNAVRGWVAKRQGLLDKVPALAAAIVENQKALTRHEAELDSSISEEFSDWLTLQKLELDLLSRKHQVRHLTALVTDVDKENSRLNSLNLDLLKVCRRQYLLMKGNNLATSDVVEDYEGVVGQVEGFKAVVWADQDDPHVPPTRIAKIAELPRLSLTSNVEGELRELMESLNRPIAGPEIKEPPPETAAPADLEGTFCVSQSPLSSTLVETSFSNSTFINENAGRTPPVASKRPATVNMKSPIVAKREKRTAENCAVPPPVSHAVSADRRLTFDAPPSSILKMREDVTNADDLSVMEQPRRAALPPPAPPKIGGGGGHPLRIKVANDSANLANCGGMRRYNSAKDLTMPRKVGLDLGNIQKLDGLRRQGFPTSGGTLPVATIVTDKYDKESTQWRSHGLKSVQAKSISKVHPYKSQQPQRMKKHASCENVPESAVSKLTLAAAKVKSKFTVGKKV